MLSLAFLFFRVVVTYHRVGESQLFPGQDQYQRFFGDVISCYSGITRQRCLKLGVNPQNDWHALNQGRVLFTYMSSLPGGSINFVSMYSCWVDHGVCQGCLHAPIYHQEISLSVAVLSMLPLLRDGVLRRPPPPPPPHFIPAWDDWGKTYSAQQFPYVRLYSTVCLRLKLMCLGSMVHHHRFIVERF